MRIMVWNGNGILGYKTRLPGTGQGESKQPLADLELMLNEQIDAIVDQQIVRAEAEGTFLVLYALGDSKSWCIPEEEVGAFESFNALASRVVARAQNRIGAATKLGACPKMLVIRGSELYKRDAPRLRPMALLAGST